MIRYQSGTASQYWLFSFLFSCLLRTMCDDPLFGDILQLNIITSFSGQCTSHNDSCTRKLRQQLQNSLSELVNTSIPIELIDDRPADIYVKLCSLTGATGKEKITSLKVVTTLLLTKLH